nr:MAG TPA: hypothetical protein [Caudoviricetes sp.]
MLFLRPCGFLTLPPKIKKSNRNAPPRFPGVEGMPRHRPPKKNAVSSPADGKAAGNSSGTPYACARVYSGRG